MPKTTESKLVLLRRHASGAFLAYDLAHKKIIHELVDYSIYLAEEIKLSEHTTNQSMINLGRFWEFLLRNKLKIQEISDYSMRKFRDQDLDLVLKSSNALLNDREALRRAKFTVNQRLSAIYSFIEWLILKNHIPRSVAGPLDCPLYIPHIATNSYRRGSSSISNIPLRFKVKKNPSAKHGRAPTDTQIDEITKNIFHTPNSPFISERNQLILDIGLTTGFRRGSIASLRCDMFNSDAIMNCREETYPVSPPQQKNAYSNFYNIPLDLAIRISEYINTSRKHLCDTKGFLPHTTQDHIFISTRTGTPIHPRSITQIFSKLMRSSGMQRGNATHALRRRFADDEIVKEINYRIEHGLDTSSQSIATSVANSLGHKSIDTLCHYISTNYTRLHKAAIRR